MAQSNTAKRIFAIGTIVEIILAIGSVLLEVAIPSKYPFWIVTVSICGGSAFFFFYLWNQERVGLKQK